MSTMQDISRTDLLGRELTGDEQEILSLYEKLKTTFVTPARGFGARRLRLE